MTNMKWIDSMLGLLDVSGYLEVDPYKHHKGPKDYYRVLHKKFQFYAKVDGEVKLYKFKNVVELNFSPGLFGDDDNHNVTMSWFFSSETGLLEFHGIFQGSERTALLESSRALIRRR